MKILAAMLISIACLKTHAQYSKHIIEFTDKKGTKHNINNPSTFLSGTSINRKSRFNIKIDSTDLPVSPDYIDSIRKTGTVQIISSSKWLNQVLIKTTDQQALNRIIQFPFVKKRFAIAKTAVQIAAEELELARNPIFPEIELSRQSNQIDYGTTQKQISIHEGEFLHQKGFTGSGMKVAVFDAGFSNFSNMRAFDSLRIKGRIGMTWDFVDNNASVSEDDLHGTHCLSIMAANIPGNFVGSAPGSTYFLFRTEDVATEYPVEEHNWAVAAEWADSIGIDVINSSLGYSKFDDPVFNYSYANMNGKSSMITRAANYASAKGLLVVNSAGNSGNTSWKYITAPADAFQILSVGAIDINKQTAGFSSYGPSADGRVKPEITSVGWNTYLVSPSGNIIQSNGTSYSAPNIAGLVTCLWQAFPEFSNKEIMDAVIRSSDKFNTPDTRVGFGIPNMRIAYQILEKERVIKNAMDKMKGEHIKAYPNPFIDHLIILHKAEANGKLSMRLLSADGKLFKKTEQNIVKGEFYYIKFDGLGVLPKGQYVLQCQDPLTESTTQVIK